MNIDFSNVHKDSQYSFPAPWAKNMALPLLFLASWLAVKLQKEIHISNVPKLKDVQTCVAYLEALWMNLLWEDNNIIIFGERSILKNTIPEDLYCQFRYSILSLGLLLSFFDEVHIPHKTGGCSIWERKNDLHYSFFLEAGFEVKILDTWVYVKKNTGDSPKKISFYPHIASTSVTENIILFSILSYKSFESIIVDNFYGIRPDISELLIFASLFWYTFNYENKLLTSVSYVPPNLDILVKYQILSDFDQALFYIMLAIVLRSNIFLTNYRNSYKYREISLINEMLGDIITIHNNTLCVVWKHVGQKKVSDLELFASEYPEIMSDSQPIISAFILFCDTIKILDARHEWRYDYSRYYNIFGYKTLLENKSLTLYRPPGHLTKDNVPHWEISLFSIRESGLLLLLGIFFETSISIKNTYILERWYENIFQNLSLIWTKYGENW